MNIHRSARPAADPALAKLFELINAAEIIYPSTNLKLVYNFVGSKQYVALCRATGEKNGC